jgi:1,4-dihydroxy-2-naphthoyl-CoA hydrolase
MDLPLPHRITEGFDGLYGLVIDEAGDGHVRAHVDLEDRHRQPAGLVHGGLIASVAEAITSMGTYVAVRERGQSAQGLSNQTSFLRPVLGPVLHAVATARHRGRTTWVWEVDVTDEQDRLCSVVRMTIAVRDVPTG